MKRLHLFMAAGLAIAIAANIAMPARAADIIAEWAKVKAPPPPALKQVTVDPKTTALLALDFMHRNCNEKSRPRCVASLSTIQKLLSEARAHKMLIVYSTFTKSIKDILPEVAPKPGDQWVHSNSNKFMHTDLEKILKDKGVKTVIVTGTSANGAALYTASAAGLRDLNVIVPVDGISASDLYSEQFTVWQLAHGPGFGKRVTITRADMIKF